MGTVGKRCRRGDAICSALSIALSVALYASTPTAHAQASVQTEAVQQYDIPAGPLPNALSAWGAQSGKQLVFPPDLVAGKTSRGVSGRYTYGEVLTRLLSGSGVTWEVMGDSTIVLKKAPDPPKAPASKPEPRTEATETNKEATELEKIVVTGSHIRGVESSSPTHIYDRQDVLRSGAQTTQGFIQTLPQNFAGGSNDGLVRGSPYDAASSSNLSLGSSVNLRGLGSGATLVLVDGQRLALSSAIGDFVDISLLPINAIKRVLVLTDGASAIYGGDAVAGVVNFALRDDFVGAETFVSYGDVTEGGSAEYRAGQTIGKGWATGNAVLAYDYHRRDPLSVLDKPFSKPIGIPIDLLPRQERHSAMASLNQQLGPHLDGWARLLYSERDAQVVRSNTATVATRTTDAFSRQTNVLGGLRGFLGSKWDFDLSGVYSRVDSDSTTPTVPGAGAGTSRETMLKHWAVEAKASGEIFRLPAGPVMAALGTAYRREFFENTNRLTGVMDNDIGRDVVSAFGELLIPLAGEENAEGTSRLELSLSGRFEDYSDFGSSSNPKVGLRWSPAQGVNVRATYGTSFKPPNLGHLGSADTQLYVFTNDILNSLLEQHPEIADSRTAFLVLGTDPRLKPETSTAMTVGFDLDRAFGPGTFNLSASYYDINFEDRINLVQVPGGAYNIYNIALSTPELLPAGTVLVEPGAQAVAELIQRAQNEGGMFDQFGVYDGDPASVGMIAFLQLTNLAKTVTRGIDLDLGYRVDTDVGNFDFSFNGNYILEFSHQSSSSTPMLDQVGAIFRPADYRLRAGASWSRAGWNSSLFVNRTDSTTDDRTMPYRKIPSFTTMDWYLGYDVGERTAGVLRNLRFDFGVDNVLDRGPPFIGNDFQFGILGYDPTNADPIGRFVSLKVTKTW